MFRLTQSLHICSWRQAAAASGIASRLMGHLEGGPIRRRDKDTGLVDRRDPIRRAAGLISGNTVESKTPLCIRK